MPADNDILIAPKGPRGGRNSSGSGGGSTNSSGSTNSTTSTGPVPAAEKDPNAYYKRQQKKADAEANAKYLAQAATLGQQVAALRAALGSGFREALDQKLANVRLTQRQQDHVLMDGYRERLGGLRGSARDNEKDADSGTVSNMGNRNRERMNALSEAMNMGAGESDMLRSQEASLRNWEANQGEINRAYRDTLRSINSSITDLTVDTKTARVNNVAQANADREQLWTNYYGQRSEAFTQLGNVQGTRADYLGMANEAVASGDTLAKQSGLSAASGKAFMDATRANSQAWENPGVGKDLMRWDGAKAIKPTLNNSRRASALTTIPTARPEGASLRKW